MSRAQATAASQNDPRPVTHAVMRTAAVVVDGKLDDAAWSSAQAITDFHQQQPDEGKAPSERTAVRVLYDGSAVYVGARMFDSQGGKAVRSLLVRRDQLLNDNASDKIALVLDPYHDRQTRVWFELNPLGVKGDLLNGDASFDPVWEGAAHIDSLGTIDGLAVSAQPRELELLPYVVSRSRFALPAPGDPFRSSRESGARVGGDLKYNITSSLTLDATVNPDFGQVEVDPAVVNLSDFETIFQEKRPFFVIR